MKKFFKDRRQIRLFMDDEEKWMFFEAMKLAVKWYAVFWLLVILPLILLVTRS